MEAWEEAGIAISQAYETSRLKRIVIPVPFVILLGFISFNCHSDKILPEYYDSQP